VGCIDADLIVAFVRGRASVGERARVEHHMDECGDCRRAVAGLASVSAIAERTARDALRESSATGAGGEDGRAGGPALAPGDLVDHYRIMRTLGRGGMGAVYLARDLALGRKVALKVLRSGLGASPAALARFRREALATAKLAHPNIVAIHAVGEHEGRPFVALEYVAGQTLRERILTRRPSLAESLRIALAIADALVHAHAQGVLHRDLKPANVVVDLEGRVRVLDFGLAKILGDDGAHDDKGPMPEPWRTGLQGTPSYMAPEQWRGEAASGQTDVWALGVILFELATGEVPFVAEDVRALADVVCRGGPAPGLTTRGVPSEVADLVAQCLARAPADRPTAVEVARALGDALFEGRRARTHEEGPFRGLLAFRERHADLFFGRDAEIASAIERLRHQPVLPVVAPSGAGKSSFVHAGLVPRLREQGRWLVLSMRPRGRPFAALAAALARADMIGDGTATRTVPPPGFDDSGSAAPGADPGALALLERGLAEEPGRLGLELRALAEEHRAGVLCVVDQLEELFTLSEQDDVRRAFLDAVSSAADDPSDPVRVVFTLRDDFLGRVASIRVVGGALAGVMVLEPPQAAALADILERPLESAGYGYDDPLLVPEMIAAVRGEPAALPLLEFTAEMLWERRDKTRRLLLRSAYVELGGVGGALAKHADGVLRGLTAKELRVARELFLRLVTADRTRRAVPRSRALGGLDDDDGVAARVLARLTEARLVTVTKSAAEPGAEPMLELAHESMIATWATLASWVEAGREEIAFLAEVGLAAELWDKRGRRPEELWQGTALRDALGARARCTTEPPELVTEFLGRARARETRRLARRRGAALLAVAGLAVVTVVLALQVREARTQRERAEQGRAAALAEERRAEERRAEALREGARAAREQRSVLEARAKLRASFELADAPLARMLWWQLEREPLLWQHALGAIPYATAWSPRGESVAVGCHDEAVYLFDVATGAARVLRGHGDQVRAVAFSPDGARLASGGYDGETRIWDASTGAGLAVLRGHGAGVTGVAFAPDGRIATVSRDRSVRLWDASGAVLAVLGEHEAAVLDVAFSRDGARVATASIDGSVRIWDTASPARAALALAGHTAAVWGVAFDAEGSRVATASRDASVRIWDARSGVLLRALAPASEGVFAVGFSPDGGRLAVGGNDQPIQLLDPASGALTGELEGHAGTVFRVAFDPRGERLVSVGDDGFVRVWDLGAAPGRRLPTGHRAAVWGVALSPDGRRIASGGRDETVHLWDADSGEPLRALAGNLRGVAAVTYDPSGSVVAAACEDGVVRLWDVASGRVRPLRGHDAGVVGVAFRPDGAVLASGSRDKTVRLWDVASGATLHVLRGHAEGVYGVAFSPDGRSVAAAGIDRTVRLWDAETGAPGRMLRGHEDAVYGLSFSPDGRRLASGGFDHTLRVWEVTTGAALATLEQPGRVHGIAFHPDGARIGTAGSDGVGRIWSLDGAGAHVLGGHGDEVNAFAFSGDGTRAATASDDGTVRLWETASGRGRWRAPLLVPAPARLLTHRGWRRLVGDGAASPAWAAQPLAAAEEADAASLSGATLCTLRDGTTVLWDVSGSEPLARAATAGARELVALDGVCAVGSAGGVLLLGRSGPVDVALGGPPTAMTALDGVLHVAAGSEIVVVGADGSARERMAIGPGVTALALARDAERTLLLLGHRDGNVEARPRTLPLGAPTLFERTPSSAVRRIVAGPMGTVVVGHDDGALGIWHVADGARLAEAHLHGAVTHLLLEGQQLVAATELGQSLVWDLSALRRDRCELLRGVWERVGVVWEAGAPVRRPPPAAHPCQSGSASSSSSSR
jgi:WD40 repeat protein